MIQYFKLHIRPNLRVTLLDGLPFNTTKGWFPKQGLYVSCRSAESAAVQLRYLLGFQSPASKEFRLLTLLPFKLLIDASLKWFLISIAKEN